MSRKWTGKRMGGEVFDLALERLGTRTGARMYAAARAVMVDGASIAEASRLHGTVKKGERAPLDRKTVYEAIERVEGSYAMLGICPYCGSKLPAV